MSVILNIVSAFDSKGVKKAQQAFKQLETTTQQASYALKQYGGPAATAAIGAVTAELVRAVNAAAEDQKSQEQLKIALENTVGANKLQVAAVEDSITALMFQTATADDDLRPALSKLVRATQDVTQAQSLLKLALDISAGSGRDFSSVTSALSRAALGSFTALTKLGIPLDQNAVKAKDLDGVLSSLSSSFAGAATKNAQTFEGQLKNLKIAVGELEENVGKQLIPVLSDYATVLVDLTTKTAGADSSTKTWFGRIVTGIGYLAKNTPALGPLLSALGLVNDKVREQAEAIKQNSQVTSRVTKVFKDFTLVEDKKKKSTKASTDATDKAKAAAKAYAEWLAKCEAAAAKLKAQLDDAAQTLRDGLNVRLEDAQNKLKTAQQAFDDFGKSVGAAVTGSFNFGAAQSEATSNAADLKKALDKQAEAQAKVNEAQADFDFFKRDDYAKVLADAMGELAIATGEVTAAQAKPMTFFENLSKQADKAKKFGELVSRLMAGNLNEAALQQVLAAGVDGGTLIAEEILGSADGILRANDLTASMTKLAKDMADKSAAKYYQAGVDSATSFLKGIEDTIAKVEVILANPNLTMTDIINAGLTTGIPDISGADLSNVLSGINFGMGTLMASGGVVTRAQTVTVGEAGPEAIIPLDKMSSMGFGGNGGGVTINVNGGDPNAVVQALRNYMRQNGSIPIKTANLY